jgi:hypothetical protein
MKIATLGVRTYWVAMVMALKLALIDNRKILVNRNLEQEIHLDKRLIKRI